MPWPPLMESKIQVKIVIHHDHSLKIAFFSMNKKCLSPLFGFLGGGQQEERLKVAEID